MVVALVTCSRLADVDCRLLRAGLLAQPPDTPRPDSQPYFRRSYGHTIAQDDTPLQQLRVATVLTVDAAWPLSRLAGLIWANPLEVEWFDAPPPQP